MKTLVGFDSLAEVPFSRRHTEPEPDQLDMVRSGLTPRHCLFKTEVIKPQRPWKTLAHVELATAEWVDWYNHRRLHGEIGHIPPAEYEANYYGATTKPQATATI